MHILSPMVSFVNKCSFSVFIIMRKETEINTIYVGWQFRNIWYIISNADIQYDMFKNFRGRKGFDGDFELERASSGGHRFKSLNLNIKANNNLAYAA